MAKLAEEQHDEAGEAEGHDSDGPSGGGGGGGGGGNEEGGSERASKPKVTQVMPLGMEMEGGGFAEAKPSPFDPQAAAADLSGGVAEAKGVHDGGGWPESKSPESEVALLRAKVAQLTQQVQTVTKESERATKESLGHPFWTS